MVNFVMSKLQLPISLPYQKHSPELVTSKLYDEHTFYKQFMKDLKASKREVIVESPFISSTRMYSMTPLFRSLVAKKVKCYVITRDPDDHDIPMKQQAEKEIRKFQTIGVQVILTNEYSHRKLAIIDRKVLWEGSLNILSQTCSQEIMRRIESKEQAQRCFDFVRFGKFIY
jgi:phosphatidylserine/phosphatidylglycerophosphate/cardiolipin synthase-like enzyme